MTTSAAAKRSPGVRTTPSIKVTLRLNFFIISTLSDLLRLKKPLTIRLPHFAGSGEAEWRKAWSKGEICDAQSRRCDSGGVRNRGPQLSIASEGIWIHSHHRETDRAPGNEVREHSGKDSR